MKAEEEWNLIKKAQSGDKNAFEPLVTEYERLVYTVAFRLLGSAQDAQDAAQESFLKAYRALGSFRGECRFSVWLYRLTNNVCLDMLRKKRMKTVSLSAGEEDGENMQLDIPDSRFSPEAMYEKKELRENVRRALAQLPVEFRQVLVMREIAGQSYVDIAEALQLDIGTVKSRIFRARKKLCAILLSDGNIHAQKTSKDPKGGMQA